MSFVKHTATTTVAKQAQQQQQQQQQPLRDDDFQNSDHDNWWWWWQALGEWYNHCDYQGAVELWLPQLPHSGSWFQNDDRRPAAILTATDYSMDHLEWQWKDWMQQQQEQQQTSEHDEGLKSSSSSSSHQQREQQQQQQQQQERLDLAVSRLLVFLAGCCLDARNVGTARKCLVQSLQISCRYKNPELAADALQEYMASYQEEEEQQQPHWLVARRVVQLALQSTFITRWNSVYQRPAYLYEYGTSATTSNSSNNNKQPPKAVYPASEHPAWCRTLEQNAGVIIAEFEQLLRVDRSGGGWNGEGNNGRCHSTSNGTNNNSTTTTTTAEHLKTAPQHWPAVGSGQHRGGAGEHDGTVVEPGGDWREIVLLGATGARPELAPATVQLLVLQSPPPYPPLGHDDDDDVERENAIQSLATAGAGEVIFSVLAPHTRIAPHTAPHNLRLTAHLGLRIPALAAVAVNDDNDQCYLRVANETCHWETGKMLVFDDSYEHEVVNDTDEIRGVLLIRFWHPDIPVNQRTRALQQVLTAKREDQLRRCNPPLPPPHNNNTMDSAPNVTERGMERSVCSACWLTGYVSIRLIVEERIFVCACGMPI